MTAHEIVPLKNLDDRLFLCWGHLDDWKNLDIVKQSREWLKTVNAVTLTTFMAYKDQQPAGMIEFIPYNLLREHGFCPCRAGPQDKNMLKKEFEPYLIISCLYVDRKMQQKGIGTALLTHLLTSDSITHYDGVLVYVAKREETWDEFIHWPAGSKEFYINHGFSIIDHTENEGYILRYKKQ